LPRIELRQVQPAKLRTTAIVLYQDLKGERPS
jgi:hypothetical protein